MDSSVSEPYGRQRGAVYGYFACACHHPLSLLDQYGDLERALPPRGNQPGAGFWGRLSARR